MEADEARRRGCAAHSVSPARARFPAAARRWIAIESSATGGGSFSVPVSVAAAVYVAEYASRRARELIKPVIELLAGIPSVVIGFFALVVIAGWVQSTFGTAHRLNAVVAGIGLAFAIAPVVFTVATTIVVALERFTPWVDLLVASEPLMAGSMGGTEWAHLGTASLLWLGLPMAVGTWRVLTKEIA